MKLKIEICLDNSAFEAEGQTSRLRNGDEPARILRKFCTLLEGNILEVGDDAVFRDINGNKVGLAKVTR